MQTKCELFPHIYTEGFHLPLQFSLQIHMQCVSLYAMQNRGDIAAKTRRVVCVRALAVSCVVGELNE